MHVTGRLGTDKAPLFDHLKIATQGGKVAQLTLNAELYLAIERGATNPKSNPAKYNDLRYEVIGYLENLSDQGAGLASLKLSREYHYCPVNFQNNNSCFGLSMGILIGTSNNKGINSRFSNKFNCNNLSICCILLGIFEECLINEIIK